MDIIVKMAMQCGVWLYCTKTEGICNYLFTITSTTNINNFAIFKHLDWIAVKFGMVLAIQKKLSDQHKKKQVLLMIIEKLSELGVLGP